MIIIGGVGSILGSFLGAAFIVLLPILAQRPRARAVAADLGGVEPRADGVRRADHLLPDRRAARPRAPVADRQGEAAAVAVPALRCCNQSIINGSASLSIPRRRTHEELMKAIKCSAGAAPGRRLAASAPRAGRQFIPLLSYRVGPYAAGGSGFFGGIIDYFNLVNANGGINGVKIDLGRMRDRIQRLARRRMLRAPEDEERRRDRWSSRCRPASPTASWIAWAPTRSR